MSLINPKKRPAKTEDKPSFDYKALRLKLNLNQSDFWGNISVTQSGGSRYEHGCDVPPSTHELLHLVYIN